LEDAMSEFKFDIGDVVHYVNRWVVPPVDCNFQIVKRHKGKVRNLYTCKVIYDRYGYENKLSSKNYVKDEKCLTLVQKSFSNKWIKKASEAFIVAGGIVPVEMIESMTLLDFAHLCEVNSIDLVWTRGLDEATKSGIRIAKQERMDIYTDYLLDEEFRKEEKNLIHFGE
jgi:hypothetical protein